MKICIKSLYNLDYAFFVEKGGRLHIFGGASGWGMGDTANMDVLADNFSKHY